MTQKKLRISPEDIDIGKVKKKLNAIYRVNALRKLKRQLRRSNSICGYCAGWCGICNAIFPKAYGCGRSGNNCPCHLYLKKDVVHVVEYLLLNLKV